MIEIISEETIFNGLTSLLVGGIRQHNYYSTYTAEKGGNLPPISVKDTDFLYVDKYAIHCIMKVQKGATE